MSGHHVAGAIEVACGAGRRSVVDGCGGPAGTGAGALPAEGGYGKTGSVTWR
ncbi:MAG TPA: hypothetical protein VG123_25120 [Streptosporangiaceae bacterium]|nr:hypothetical protein [Streptosporangiaceae bacterium]